MLIETNASHRLIQVLNLGSFPAEVESFSGSYDYLEKLIYNDYLAQKRFQGISGLSHATDKDLRTEENIDFLDSLIGSIESINAEFSTGLRSYQEVLYSVTVLAYLHLLRNDKQACLEVLRSFRFDTSLSFETEIDKRFYDYLYARYCSLMGLSSDNSGYWIDYLLQLEKYGDTSEVAKNIWIQCLCRNLIRKQSLNGTNPLTFLDFEAFGLPECSFIILLNCLMKHENEQYVAKSVFKDYSKYLSNLLDSQVRSKTLEFPDSDNKDKKEENFVNALFETLNDVSSHRPVVHYFLKPKSAKSFLVSKLQTTYQSRVVLLNMIKTQIDLQLYDEAIAAFKTYNSYVLKEKEQNGNHVDDILQILDIFSHCFQSFNPSSSFRSEKLFKYNDSHEVIKVLTDLVPTFLEYLNDACVMTDLNYDEKSIAVPKSVDETIAFLYQDLNPQFVSGDNNKLSSAMANAWYSLSKFYQYLATFNSSEELSMAKYMHLGTKYLFRSLILDCSGNVSQLHNYALVLAYQNKLRPAVKLCKFTLKKYPYSFKTWNLLALVTSAIEKSESSKDTTAVNLEVSTILDDSFDQSDSGIAADTSKLSLARETGSARLEKFILDALNLASIFLLKQKKLGKELTDETKYDVIQLKITQLELLRQKHGVDYTFELVSELFDLYREIYLTSTSARDAPTRQQNKRWSHRPSIIDPREAVDKKEKEHSKSRLIHEKFREHSEKKLSSDAVSPRESGHFNGNANGSKDTKTKTSTKDTLVLQEIWLWTAGLYQELDLYEEAEQCIVEAETVHEPNPRSFTAFGTLASKSRKFLALQEYEKSLEIYHQPGEKFNTIGYGQSLLAMCHLFMIDDEKDRSLFISEKDRDAGLVRVKNYLETYSHCWPYGYSNSGVWYYLSLIYEKFDDKLLYEMALWRCVEVETFKPVRPYNVCELLGQ